METTIRTSGINDINTIRKKLWETTYSSFVSVDMLKCFINNGLNQYGNNALGKNILQEISFDMNNMQIELVLSDIVSNVVLNSILSESFCNYIDWMYERELLNVNEYNICKSRTNMLFNLMLNTDTKAVIKL
jgi:23S rRNA U2552 (ribose-2'-O)-methylase RlmE/FtsJ